MNMKKILLTMAVLAMVGSVAMAGPSLGYWNNGDAGSTHQVWSFDTGDAVVVADNGFVNPYGDSDPTATITAEASGSVGSPGWKASHNGKSGVWAGDPVSFKLDINNTPSTEGKKTVWMEITAEFVWISPLIITAYDADMNVFGSDQISFIGDYSNPLYPYTVTDISGDDLDSDQWKSILIGWEIIPNPQSEIITVGIGGTGGFVDKIVVDTMCAVPAPGALLLGGFGTAIVSFLRRRRSV